MTKPVAILLFLSLECFASIIYAEVEHDHEIASELLKQGNILPLEVILKHARRIQNGQILEVELTHKTRQLIYEVEFLTPEGKVLELFFDATTGRYLATHRED